MTLAEFLPIMVQVLLIVFLVVLIILGIKCIIILNKTDKLLDDVQNKVSSFNSIFSLVDSFGTTISSGIMNIVEFIVNSINKIIKRGKEDEDE